MLLFQNNGTSIVLQDFRFYCFKIPKSTYMEVPPGYQPVVNSGNKSPLEVMPFNGKQKIPSVT